MPSLKVKTKGVIALVALSFVYSIVALIPRYLSASFELFQQIYLRVFLGFIFATIFFRKNINFNKIITSPLKDLGLIFLRATSYYLLGVALWTQALLLTKISNVALIGAIPMTAILGWIILKERFTWQKASLVLLAFLGTLIISIKKLTMTGNFVLGKGELLIFASTFFLALGKISRKWESKRLNDKEASVVLLFFSALLLFLASLFKGEGLPIITWHLGTLLVLVIAGLSNVAIAFLVSYGFARVKAVLANNIIQLDIPLSILLAFIFYQELPVFRELIGGGIIVTSVILMNRLEKKSPL